MPVPSGTRLGRYEIRALLGTGGMGEVYRAHDTTLHRDVAVKVLPTELARNPDGLRRIEQEAHAASSLNHPNILTVHEIGRQEQTLFVATEFIEGESLRERLLRQGLELREVLEIGEQLASALSAAHAAGIVHRDIKPENIMIRKDGIVKVLDFGLAKFLDSGAAASNVQMETVPAADTVPGLVLGTPNYMSPEQARGLATDSRTDVWSLGVVMYELLCGRVPFQQRTTSDVIAAILTSEPTPLTRCAAGIPAELERIVSKALRKDREERYQAVSDLGVDLKALKRQIDFDAERARRADSAEVAGKERGATRQRWTPRVRRAVAWLAASTALASLI
jgi:serine/threonine protein kinase